jgi:hypothetical protein
MLASITHIIPLTTIRRERFLPVSGRLLVRKGQKVSTTDIVGEAKVNSEHLLMDLVRGLGVPVGKADNFLQCKAGDRVMQDDVLAGPVGLTKRVLRAPGNARVIVAGEGQVLLELESSPMELKAGLPGMVIDLLADRGVVIETTGALIQGVWGNGEIDYGLMIVLARSSDDELTVDRLDVSLRGSIVMGGYCKDAEVLKTAASSPLRGLILASMDPSLVPVASKIKIPVIVIEGFGNIPMNSAAYKLLSTNDQREVSLNAERWDRFTGVRPEIIIPLPAPGEPALPPDADLFTAGQQVRVVRAPHKSEIGTIIEIRAGMTALNSGLQAPAAEIRLESGENALLPLANLEVLE